MTASFAAIDIFTACDGRVLQPVRCRNNHRHPDRRCLQRERNRFGRPRSYLLVAPVSAYYVCATRQQFTALTVACDVQTDLSNPSASSMRPSMAPCLSRSKMPLMTSVAGSQLKMDAILLRPRTAVPAFAALIQSLRFQPFWFGRAAGNEDSSK